MANYNHTHSPVRPSAITATDDSTSKQGAVGSNRTGEAARSERNFPVKLWDLLASLEDEGLDHIVSWAPHGRCFLVRNQEEFVQSILPVWFRQSKLTSFQRQLNIYGFTRLTSGKDKHGYYHPLFLRNDRNLAKKIERHKLKGTGTRKPGEPDKEPNFYSMPYIPPPPKNVTSAAATNTTIGIPGLTRAVAQDHSARSSLAAADDTNNVLLAQLLAAQQQSRFPTAASTAALQDELAFLRTQQQQAAARRALALESLGLGGTGALSGPLGPLVGASQAAAAESAQLELLLAQARLKAYMGGSGIAVPTSSQPGLLVPTLAGGPGSGAPYIGAGADTLSLIQGANSRAALIQNILGLSSLGDTDIQQDALRRALLQSSLGGRRDL